MDSKRMRRAMAGMIVVFLTVFAVIAIVNWDTVKRKLGFATEEPVQEEEPAQEEAGTEDGQIGGDLSAFLRDETFFRPRGQIQKHRILFWQERVPDDEFRG